MSAVVNYLLWVLFTFALWLTALLVGRLIGEGLARHFDRRRP